MQVTMKSIPKQRASSVNTSRSYKKGISLTSKSRCQSTQRNSFSDVSILAFNDQVNFNDQVLSARYTFNDVNIEGKNRNLYVPYDQIKQNPKIIFKYTNTAAYKKESIISEMSMRSNRFIHPVSRQTVKNNLIEVPAIMPIKQTEVLKKQIVEPNAIKYLIDSRRVPRTVCNEQVKIIINKIQRQFIQSQPAKLFGTIVANNSKEQTKNINTQNLIQNQQDFHSSPYHQLFSTKKKQQYSTLEQIPEMNQIQPFQIRDLDQNGLIFESKQIIIQKSERNEVNNQLVLFDDRICKNKENKQKQVKQQKVLKSSQKVNKSLITKTNIKKSDINTLQNIQNINPSTKYSIRSNNKRIREIQKRLSQIISICDDNL